VKIVYAITRGDAVGGASIHVRDLGREMIRRGAAVTVIVGAEGPVTKQLEAAGVPFRVHPSLRRRIHPARDLGALADIVAALKDLRPDLVSTHTAKAGWIARAAATRLGIPALYTPHGWSIGTRLSPLLGGMIAVAERAAARWCSAIVCVCEDERRLALAKRIAPPEKLLVVHNGVRDVDPSLLARPESEPVRLCSVARFESPKDHETLLSALAGLSDQSWQIDLIGDGPLLPQRRRQAERLGIAGRVHFHGYVADPARILSRAQLFVLSTRSEAFPRSILEAMRAGLPVVASDVGGVRESVADGLNGTLTQPHDVGALAAALTRLLADPHLRREMGRSGRAAYESRFRFDQMLDRTVGVYNKLIGQERSLADTPW
jgi:glycosyltransferase involved in cell wall biosynthesis